jgi:hypothetical protein
MSLIDFDELRDALEDFALNGDDLRLSLTFYSSRDGSEYTETVSISGNNLLAFSLEQPETPIFSWDHK